nr:PREDICTED: uncharacterized protein LOC108214074 isoform X2 [Daucus carota subsp. sativus]
MVVTRRSGNNAAEKMVVRSPKKRPTTKRGLKCRKPQHKQPSKKELVTPCRGRAEEAETENVGGEEIMPLDISSGEESKPQENLKTLMDAAAILKDELVSHLEKTAHKLDTVDMLRSANKCFTALKLLKVDYEAFHGEVHKLIKHTLELSGDKEKSTCTDLGLKVAYEKSVSNVNAAREKLTAAEYNLMNAKTDYDYTIEKIKKLKAVLHKLEVEAATERDGIENLTSKRDHCNEAFSLAVRIKLPYEEVLGSLERLWELV